MPPHGSILLGSGPKATVLPGFPGPWLCSDQPLTAACGAAATDPEEDTQECETAAGAAQSRHILLRGRGPTQPRNRRPWDVNDPQP